MADRKRRAKKGQMEEKEEKLDKSSKAILSWLRNNDVNILWFFYVDI